MPYEREWLTHLYEEQGWVDAFREFTSEPELYTWWSNRGQAWANNTGWRLDYMLVSPGLSGRAREVAVYKEARFSDHAPVIIDFEM
jgi:exodeoxyribonuclease-3